MKRFRAGRLIVFALAGLGLALLVRSGPGISRLVLSAVTRVEALGSFAPLAFIVLYAIAEIAFVPGSLFTLAAGALFGVFLGTLVAMVGATLGASGAFLVARYAARRPVERWISSSEKLRALSGALAVDGRRLVFLMRLTPLIPFNALNYALGVTRVRFVDYLVASAGMLPGALLYAYYGSVVGDVARVASGVTPPRGIAYDVLLGAGLSATIVLAALLARAARRALTDAAGRIPAQ